MSASDMTADTNEELRQFMQTIQRVRPPYGDLVSNGIAAMAESNVAAERTQEMQRLAVYFARAYQGRAQKIDAVHSKADDLEAAIMTIETLGVISSEKSDGLVDSLHDLIAHREVQ